MSERPQNSAVWSFIVERRIWLALFVLLVTVFLGFFIPDMKLDRTMKSGISATSQEYLVYSEFLKVFGEDEFILIAIRTPNGAQDPSLLKSLDSVTKSLREVGDVADVISLTGFSLFQNKGDLFGSYPLVEGSNGEIRLPAKKTLEMFRSYIPVMDFLVSEDLRTTGILVNISDRAKLDPDKIGHIMAACRAILDRNLPKGAEYRMVGSPVIKDAIQRYNLQTAIMFGILCSLVATGVSIYIFKSLRVTVITLLVVGVCVVWMIGLMSLADIRLNSTTGLAFGLVLVVSVAAVVHIVTHYNERYREVGDPVEATKQALGVVARPCLMCSLTTAAGFASITISSIPMVRQLGIIMAMGVMISYGLAIILTPALLAVMKPPGERTYRRMASDWVAIVFDSMERFVFGHPRMCAAGGIVLMAVMLAGAPQIRSDTQILRMLSESTPEIGDLRFVEKNLTPVFSFEVSVEAERGAFKYPRIWRKMADAEARISAIPEVVRTDSLLSVLKYLHQAVSEPGSSPDEIFTKPRMIKQLVALISLSGDGRSLISRYVSNDYHRARINVRIANTDTKTIGEILAEAQAAADEAFKGTGALAHVTGDLAVFQAQASDLVQSQLMSLALALTTIITLMIIQFRSILLGLLGLIPNILPLAVIFGIMGWAGISLDSVTVFAATVSIGLSVDDTIHYLTQLQRQIKSKAPGEDDDVAVCLAEAYQITAKALISTSAVLFLGFIMLVWSPFQPVIAFGILGSSAILAALVGDLIFLPSVILSIGPVKRLVARKIPG